MKKFLKFNLPNGENRGAKIRGWRGAARRGAKMNSRGAARRENEICKKAWRGAARRENLFREKSNGKNASDFRGEKVLLNFAKIGGAARRENENGQIPRRGAARK